MRQYEQTKFKKTSVCDLDDTIDGVPSAQKLAVAALPSTTAHSAKLNRQQTEDDFKDTTPLTGSRGGYQGSDFLRQ